MTAWRKCIHTSDRVFNYRTIELFQMKPGRITTGLFCWRKGGHMKVLFFVLIIRFLLETLRKTPKEIEIKIEDEDIGKILHPSEYNLRW